MRYYGDILSIPKHPQKRNAMNSTIQKEVKKGQDIKSNQFSEIMWGKHVFLRVKNQIFSRRYE